MSGYALDWASIAFGNRDKVSNLRATLIAAPRELSAARLKQLIKSYLPKGNMIIGLAKEPYVMGFEDQPQFRMYKPDAAARKIIDQVNAASKTNKIYTLAYFPARNRIYIRSAKVRTRRTGKRLVEVQLPYPKAVLCAGP
nr:Unknown Function [uncultured bacterium]